MFLWTLVCFTRPFFIGITLRFTFEEKHFFHCFVLHSKKDTSLENFSTLKFEEEKLILIIYFHILIIMTIYSSHLKSVLKKEQGMAKHLKTHSWVVSLNYNLKIWFCTKVNYWPLCYIKISKPHLSLPLRFFFIICGWCMNLMSPH